MKIYILLLSIILVFSKKNEISDKEIKALKDFYTSMNGDNWVRKDNWMSDVSPCEWFGVKCEYNELTGIFLARNNLDGQFVNSFGYLKNLKNLDLASNKIKGHFPYSFLFLTKLVAVSFRYNQLEGDIGNFRNCENMKWMHLDWNNVTGDLNSLANRMPNLRVLGLTGNKVQGTINFNLLKSFPQIQILSLGMNKISGNISEFLSGHAPDLENLDLCMNNFCGSLNNLKNDSALKMPSLTELELFGNNIDGDIKFLNLPKNLAVLDFHKNNLTGWLPSKKDDSGIINLENVEILNLENNHFVGFFPQKWSSSKIHKIRLKNNPLLCPINITDTTKVEADCTYWNISEVKPSVGHISGGNNVHLYGEGFQNRLDIGGTTLECMFGDTPSIGYVISSNIIRCITPKVSKAGLVNVTIRYQEKYIAHSKAVFLFASNMNKIQHFNFNSQLNNKKVDENIIKLPQNKNENKNAPPVEVILLGMSKCPDWVDIQKIFKEILEDIGEIVNITMGFIAVKADEYSTGFWSLHGQTEVIGNTITLCTDKIYGKKQAFDLADCMNKDLKLIPTNLDKCAFYHGLNSKKIRTCALGEEGRRLNAEAVALSKKYNGVWCPTIYINNEFYCAWHSMPCKAKSRKDFGKEICQTYQGEKPKKCSKYL